MFYILSGTSIRDILLFNTMYILCAYHLQPSVFYLLILAFVLRQYHATISTPRQECVKSSYVEAVVAMRTTFRHWRSVINSVILMVRSKIQYFILEVDLDYRMMLL